MIEDAFDCHTALNDTVDDHPELEDLRLTEDHWKQLEDIKTIPRPFLEYTEFVSKNQPTLQLSARIYIQLENTLKGISKMQGKYTHLNKDLVTAVEKGLLKFEEYNGLMKEINIYYIAYVLDPQIKTQFLKDNIEDADEIIERIQIFLKATYPSEPELPLHNDEGLHRSLEYRF